MKLNNFEPKESTNVFKYITMFTLVLIFIWVISFFLGAAASVANVAKQELGPQAALKKYEWFKDTSNELNRKLTDINIYEQRTSKCYKFTPNKCDIIEEQLFGLKSNYNSLVAEYNSNSKKINWELFDAEDIPTTYRTK